MSRPDAIERELDDLRRQLAEGEITLQQYNAEVRAMEREYRAAAEDAAQEAYEREKERW